ncbi:MAG: putative lipid II flippase FtsW [Lachnospiraceae bacterium]|jgi:cell division protein FtsW|nr:putative lipid II flippase FtsW [Lachnospiraceae bacterium]
MDVARAGQSGVRRKKRERAEYFFDYSLLLSVFFLLGFGLVMIYSTSSYEAYQEYQNSTYFLTRQAWAVLLGLVGMMLVSNIDYHFWEKFNTLGYLVTVFLLALIPFFGIKVNGAKRWLPLPLIGFNLQPAEVAKLCMILFLASTICKIYQIGRKIRTWKSFVVLIILPMPIVLMIYLITDNLSSAIIVLAISCLMVFVASPNYKKFLLLGGIGVAAVAGVIAYIVHSANNATQTMGFRGARILAWLNPEAFAQDQGFQTIQALYAIGSGGIWGKGLGESMQKLGFLPEAQNDMIFSIICEELGLFGAVSIILLFILLLWRMMIIANNAPDLFGALLVVGVISHIGVQVILNIAVVTNTVPNTGISLPFISYGGSSVLFLMAEIGLVLSVAKRIQLKDQ